MKPKNLQCKASIRAYAMVIVAIMLVGLFPESGFAGDGGAIMGATQQELKPTSPVSQRPSGVGFGYSIGIDGDVLVVGAPYEDSDISEILNVGAAYVFERRDSTWVEVQKILAPEQSAHDRFGFSVDVALGDAGTDYIVVGAPGHAGRQGRVYFFRRDGNGSWNFESALGLSDPDTSDQLGYSVAIDYFVPPASPTNKPVFIAAATAPYNASNLPGHHWNGSLSFYQRTGELPAWSETHEFFGADGDILGISMSMENQDLIVGVDRLDTAGINRGGGISFTQNGFDGTSFNYVKGSDFIATDARDETLLGHSSAIGSDPMSSAVPMALGDPFRDDAALTVGTVYIYDLAAPHGSVVTEQTRIVAPVAVTNARFGHDVDFSQDLLAISAPGVGPDGTVFLYEKGVNLQQWNLLGPLTIADSPPDGNCFGGRSVAVNGSILVAGCTGEFLEDDAIYLFDGTLMFKSGFEN